jgi:hypothetical protein
MISLNSILKSVLNDRKNSDFYLHDKKSYSFFQDTPSHSLYIEIRPKILSDSKSISHTKNIKEMP